MASIFDNIVDEEEGKKKKPKRSIFDDIESLELPPVKTVSKPELSRTGIPPLDTAISTVKKVKEVVGQLPESVTGRIESLGQTVKGVAQEQFTAIKKFLIDKPAEAAPIVREFLADQLAGTLAGDPTTRATREAIEARAQKTGKVPVTDVINRTLAESIPDLIPLTPAEIVLFVTFGKVINKGISAFSKTRLGQASMRQIPRVIKQYIQEAKLAITTKKVKKPIGTEEIKDFFIFGRQKLSPEVYEQLLRVPKDQLVAALKARQGVSVDVRVPRFGGKGTPIKEAPGAAPAPSGGGFPPPAVVVGPQSVGENGVVYLQEKFPTFNENIKNQAFPVNNKQLNEITTKAAGAGEAALIQGVSPEEADITAMKTFNEEMRPVLEQKAQEEAQERAKVEFEALKQLEQPLTLEESLIPPAGELAELFQEPGDVGDIFDAIEPEGDIFDAIEPVEAPGTPELKPTQVSFEEFNRRFGDGRPEAEVQDEFQDLVQRAEEGLKKGATQRDIIEGARELQERESALQGFGTDLENFILAEGGLKRNPKDPGTGKIPESEEFESNVPKRLRTKKVKIISKEGIALELGRTPDQMQEAAIEAGVLEPGESLLNRVGNLPQGSKPTIKEFVPLVLSRIEQEGGVASRPKPAKGLREEAEKAAGVKKEPEPKILSETQALHLSLRSQARGAKAGVKVGRTQVKSAKEILDRRRSFIRGVKEEFKLSDKDLKKITGKDIRLMNNYEFKLYLDDINAKAAQLEIKSDAKFRVLSQLNEKEFVKVENLRKFFKFPSIEKMTTDQLNQFNQELETYQKGDEFLSVRKLETVKNTELAGVKTVREAKEVLAKKLKVPFSEVDNIDVSPFDKLRFDAALAEQNPFYRLLVDEMNTSLIEAEQKFHDFEIEVDDLTKKARASKKRSLVDRAIPSDELVFNYLEAKPDKKADIATKMTDEEIDLANYLQARFAEFRDYLIQQGTLTKYRPEYITNVRRDFLEAWKEDGILAAGKEVISQAREDAVVFKILEDDTQNILPLEKFFQFAMRRSGGLKPSKNVAKAFKVYTNAILKKQALDKIIPSLDIYAHVLTPRALTPRGLEMDRRMVKFVKEWVNNKKGRKSSLGGIVPQGGVVDIGLRALNSLVTMIDLGINIPVGAASTVGEQVVSFVNLGAKQYTLGLVRMQTAKGKKIISENRGFIGKSLWQDLSDTADNIGDTFNKTLFGLFNIATTTANKVHLLGSLTKAEWESGKISNERKADLRREIGRLRAVQGAKSILGATSTGNVLTKYKTWMLPVLRTVINDLAKVSKMAAGGKFQEVSKSREFHELLRATFITALAALAGAALVDDEDDSFIGEMIRKTQRESMTIIGSLDPTNITSLRLLSFVNDLAESLKMIVRLEEYKKRPEYKGIAKLKRTITPRAIKLLFKKEEKKTRKRLKRL